MKSDEYPHREISRSIIGAAMTVLNTLGPGLREKTYERALVIELRRLGHTVQQQEIFNVFYQDVLVDTFVPDLIVDEKVIVDPKCVSEFCERHRVQMLGYLAITRLKLALLFSFQEIRLKWKRVVR